MWHRSDGTDVLPLTQCCSPNAKPTATTRHTASTSTHWHCAFGICWHSNKTRAPIANLPNSAQLEGTPTIPPSYIWVRAVVCTCSEGQTDRQTHRRAWLIYVSCRLRLTQKVAIHLLALYPVRTRWASPEETFTHSTNPRGHYTTSSINFRHFLRSTASSLHICWVWQFFSITSVQAFFGLPLGLTLSTS